MNAKIMENVSLSITMITYATAQVDSKVKNVKNLNSALNANLIHVKMVENVYVTKKMDTSADAPEVLKGTNVSLLYNHHAPPVQTILTAQPTVHLTLAQTVPVLLALPVKLVKYFCIHISV